MTSLAKDGEIIVLAIRLVPVEVVDADHSRCFDVVSVSASLALPPNGFFEPLGDLVPICRIAAGVGGHGFESPPYERG